MSIVHNSDLNIKVSPFYRVESWIWDNEGDPKKSIWNLEKKRKVTNAIKRRKLEYLDHIMRNENSLLRKFSREISMARERRIWFFKKNNHWIIQRSRKQGYSQDDRQYSEQIGTWRAYFTVIWVVFAELFFQWTILGINNKN